MIKAVLVEELAARFMMPKREAAIVVQAIFDTMATALVRGDKIELRGFGPRGGQPTGSFAALTPRAGARVECRRIRRRFDL